jgi:hypothetical protein
MIAFEPRLGKARSPSGLSLSDAAASLLLRRLRRDTDTAVYLPLRISGLAPDVVLKGDRADMRVIDANGSTTRLGPTEDLEIFKPSETPQDCERSSILPQVRCPG